MTNGVINERGHVDVAVEANTVYVKGSVSGYLYLLGGQQEIMADEMVPSMSKSVEGIGTDMQ